MRDIGVNSRVIAIAAVVAAMFVAPTALADRFQSTNYTIDAGVAGNSLGGTQTSANYNLVSSGGESVIGNATAGSYKIGQGYVAQLEKSIQLTVQPTGMQAYWPMDENTGTAVWDGSANANNGQTQAGPTWTTGKIGSALTFNGSSQYTTFNDFDIAGTITVEAWVKPATGTTSGTVISKHSTTADNQSRIVLASGIPSFTITTGGTTRTATGGSALADNTWSHVVGVYSGTNAMLYVNGTQVDTTAATGVIATNNFVWTVGRDANAATGFLNGSVDEVKVLSRALNSEEISAEYSAQNAGIAAGIAFVGGVIPGASNTSSFDAVMQTDAAGYNLAINQDQNLTSGANTIPAMGGSIGTPAAWAEGTTKGLGFTLYGTNATAIAGKWGSGSNYAALPGSATTFYTRTGYTAGTKDYLNMRLRLDVAKTQTTGTYTNKMIITGTMTP